MTNSSGDVNSTRAAAERSPKPSVASSRYNDTKKAANPRALTTKNAHA